MSSRHLTWFLPFAVAWLASSCDRGQPPSDDTRGAPVSVAGTRSTSGPGSAGPARGSATGGSASHQPPPPEIDPAIMFDAAKTGMRYLAKKAEQSEQARTKQVEKLDRQIAQIQKLVDAGKYDEAELYLVDIHWIPVEPGARAEAQFTGIYDAKRTALAQLLEAKRGRAPRP
jgi:hypothetical protein